MKRARKFAMSIAMAALTISCIGYAQSTQWELDKSHSEVEFSVKHLMLTNVRGQFNDYEIKVLSDKQDFSDAKVEFVAKTKSINTDNEKRDEHLRSDDFFNAEKYPNMTFKSTSVKKVGAKKYKITGQLTIRDITKTVALDGEFGGIVKDPWGNVKTGFSLSGEINRFDYGLKWNALTEAGGFTVGKNVKIMCEVELKKK